MSEQIKEIPLLDLPTLVRQDIPTTIAKDHGIEALKDVAFGSVSKIRSVLYVQPNIFQIAGILGKYIEYPFDTVKVRLQSQPAGRVLYTGPLDCFRQSIHNTGFLGLYRGVSAPLFGAAIETSSLFFSVRRQSEGALYFC